LNKDADRTLSHYPIKMNKPKFTIDTYQKRYLEHLCEFLKMFKGSCAHNTPYHPTPLALTKITFR